MADDDSITDLSPAQATPLTDRFSVDTSRPLPHGGGGLTVYAAKDLLQSESPRIAIAVARDASPRLAAAATMTEPVEHLLTALGHGVIQSVDRKTEGYYVICQPPPGPPLSENLERWPERALLDYVLRPIAQVLDTLQMLGLTHRAIRLNNVFRAMPGQPVTLGAAWAAPPALHQPALFEPLYSAMCHPAARGEGTIADDVYSLGVLLLCLALGKVPMAGAEDATVIRAKIDLGSFTALARENNLSGMLGDLLRGMLADDPDHRPSPRLLLDTAAARGRRLAARPPRRSVRPLRVNEIPAFDSRMLAYALALDERRAIQLLRSGQVSLWLRRDLGDAALAAQVEDLVRARIAETRPSPLSDPMLVMQVVATINPRMPLAWRGVLLWPDSLPHLISAVIAGARELTGVPEELMTSDVISRWSSLPAREGRGGEFSLRPEVIPLRQALVYGDPGSLLRLFYVLNPVLPCRASRQKADSWIMTVTDLLRALERTAPESDATLLDVPLTVFIAARVERRLEPKATELIATKDAALFRLREVELLRELQLRYHPAALPKLAKWMAERLRPDLANWHNRPRREALGGQLTDAAQTGLLGRVLGVVQDATARAADRAGVQQAASELRRINAELAAIDGHQTHQFSQADRAGQAIAGGVGLATLILCSLGILIP